MKLFITTGIYHPDIGGPATYLKNIIESDKFKNLDKYVLTLSDQKKIFKIFKSSNLKIIKIKRDINILIRFFIILFFLFKYKNKTDIYYANGLFFETNIFCLLTNNNFIAKIVGDYHWERLKRKSLYNKSIEDFNKSKNLLLVLIKLIRKLSFYKCIKIIVPSNYLKNVVNSWNLKLKNIDIIYNSINTSKFKEKISKELLSKIKYSKKDKLICTISRLAKHKNIPQLINSINYSENTKHLIIGDGPLRKEIENLIISKNLTNNVFLLGALDKNQTYNYLKLSDTFVLYSSYEGFAHVILEAMYFNNLVIATDVGGNSEIIDDKKNGFLIDIKDTKKLNELIYKLKKTHRAQILIKQKFTLKKFLNSQMIENTYQSLIKQ